jgi:hypothetical protein
MNGQGGQVVNAVLLLFLAVFCLSVIVQKTLEAVL